MEVIYQAFLHVYHEDCSNAAMHLAPVRYSPITFALAEHLIMNANFGDVSEKWIPVNFVLADRDKYELDKGR